MEQEKDVVEEPTMMQKAGEFLAQNKEPIIRGACILIGMGIGFGVSYYLQNVVEGDSEEGEVIDLDEMDE